MRKNVENEDNRPELTNQNLQVLKTFFKYRLNNMPASQHNLEVWFQAVLDLLWNMGYCVTKRNSE